MISTWIRIFTKENKLVNNNAEKWAEIINYSFKNNSYDHCIYTKKYESIFGIKLNPKAGRLVDFVHFYPVSLLSNTLDKKIEPNYFKYILEHDCGMYYVYGNKLLNTPKVFQSKYTSNYLRAIELLANYENPECKKQLKYIVKWLKENMIEKNKWDLGKESKDGISFPLSNSWRTEEDRIKDCTHRIKRLLEKM